MALVRDSVSSVGQIQRQWRWSETASVALASHRDGDAVGGDVS